ncbi:MAG: hypothetical protein WA484_10805, partial [Solirubrobacteraceae bacterium]
MPKLTPTAYLAAGALAVCLLSVTLARADMSAPIARAGVSATSAQATVTATLAPSLSPDRLGAEGALTLTIGYVGSEGGVPSPVRRATLRFPVGLGIEIPHLRSCSPARLRARGPSGCPSQSLLGHGSALAEA